MKRREETHLRKHTKNARDIVVQCPKGTCFEFFRLVVNLVAHKGG